MISNFFSNIKLLLVLGLLAWGTNVCALITSYPYAESFENGFGQWSNEEGDDFDWTRSNTGTPSVETGPSGASSGDFYLFTESSSPNHPSLSAYVQAAFDFNSLSSPEITFKYHMYGSAMGSLHLDVYDGSWNLSEWSISGQQHTSADEDFTEVTVDLSAFGNLSNVIIRFRGVTGAGAGGWRSDMAIDHVLVNEQCNIIPGTASISDQFLCSSGTVDLTLSGQDAGTIQWQQSTDNFDFTDISGATSASFTTSTLASVETYYFRSVLTNGCSSNSNTVYVSVGGGGQISLPYAESFESGFGSWNDNDGEGDIEWTQNSGKTPSNKTGPNGASDGSEYLFTEASFPNYNSTAVIQSNFDLTSVTSPQITFDYHMYGSGMGSLTLEVNGNTEWSVSGQQHKKTNSAWSSQTIDLSAYAGECNVTIKFIGLTGNDYKSDMAIDNIIIEEPCALNPGTPSSSSAFICTNESVDLSLSGQDAGTIQWQQSIDNLFFEDITGATSANYTANNLSEGTTYYFRARLTNGCNAFSEAVSVSVGSSSAITLPYSESFELDLGEWTNESTGDNNDWLRNIGTTISNSTGPNGASDDSYYMFIEASAPNINSTAIMTANFNFTDNNEIIFNFDYHMYGADMGTLSILVNGNTEWSVSGQQHTSETSAWTSVQLDLSAYAGECNAVIQIVGVTGNDSKSDMAIDNIQVTNPCTVNAGSVYTSVPSLCSANTVALSLTGNDAGSIQWQSSTDNVSYTDIDGGTTSPYVTDTLQEGSTYYFRAKVIDECPSFSDTAIVNVQSNNGDIGFPYEDQFESILSDLINLVTETNDWTRITGPTTSGETGPSASQSGNYYMYIESSSPYFNSEARLQGSLDLTDLSDAYLGFYYHMYGAEMGSLAVEINGTEVWSVSGQQQSASTDPWLLAQIDLTDYLGECNLIVEFVGVTGSSHRSDIAIDSVHLNSNSFGWTGNTSTDWNTASNWIGDLLPDGSKSITIPDVSLLSGNAPILNNGADANTTNLTIQSGAQLTLGGSNTLSVAGDLIIEGDLNFEPSSSATLELTGDFTNNGNFDSQTGTISFTGGAEQIINGTGNLDFFNLDCNNTSPTGILLQAPGTIQGTLSFSDNCSFDNQSTLTLLSNNSGTGNLGEIPATASFIGSLTQERFITNTQRQWRYISSPFEDAAVQEWQDDFYITGSFTGADTKASTGDQTLYTNASLYDYEESDGGSDLLKGYNEYPDASNSELINPGKGYAAYIRNVGDVTIDVTGTPIMANDADFIFPIDFNDFGHSGIDGWNLIGNPFPSAINWSASSGWTKTNVDNAIYFTDNENGRSISYVNGISVPFGACNGVIPSSQAFWVHANNTNPVLSAGEAVKTTASPSQSFYRKSAIENLVYINIQNGIDTTTCSLLIDEDATIGFDRSEDALSFYGQEKGELGIWTEDHFGHKYVINARPASSQNQRSIPVALNLPGKGIYQFTFDNLQSLSPNVRLVLKDKVLNIETQIEAGNQYEFIYDGISDIGARFEIQTEPEEESIETSLAEIFPNPTSTNHITVYTSNIGHQSLFTIYDLAGKILFNIELNEGRTELSIPELPTGSYFYRIVGDSSAVDGKLTIRK